MSRQILKNAKKLGKSDLREITGGVLTQDLSLCGCSCTGSVTGPKYCTLYIGCPAVMTC